METLIEHDNMKLEKSGKLAWLTFTRERYLNAINMEGTRRLERFAWVLHENPDVRVVVIRGRGGPFPPASMTPLQKGIGHELTRICTNSPSGVTLHFV